MRPRRPAVLIRRYRPTDHDALYQVCLRTGADGEDATGRYDSPTLLGDLYVGPYLEFEPELAFVLDRDGRAIGYVLGTGDTDAFLDRCASDWTPALLRRQPELASSPAAARLADLDPDRYDRRALPDHPAHLHIDLLPEGQGGGWGRRLIERFLAELRDRRVGGVHLGVATANERAIGFYRHLGFTDLGGDDHARILGLDLT